MPHGADVDGRVAVQQNEVSAKPLCDVAEHPGVIEELGGRHSTGLQRLERRQAGPNQGLQLIVYGEAGDGPSDAGVGAQEDRDALLVRCLPGG